MDTVHNPDRYMADLRQLLSQGKKRIGLLVGAGAPTSVLVNKDGQIVEDGEPLIPNVDGLTASTLDALDPTERGTIDAVVSDLGDRPNIEAILSRVRQLAEAIGPSSVHGLDGTGFKSLAERLCEEIGKRVQVSLPEGGNPYVDLVSWITGTRRDHPVEIFTPNYDLLIEEALERLPAPYFDGFVGSRRPFFDSTSVLTDELPRRWTLLWKIHGSLGWEEEEDDSIVRTNKRDATALIYPEHRKYTQIGRMPYSALFERLRSFLTKPDTLLLCTGFSFSDDHICAALRESLASNAHTAVFAFQYKPLAEESAATEIAKRCWNLSVYARDGATISGADGLWRPGQSPNKDWEGIREAFWRAEDDAGEFLLGDFSRLANFLALIHAQRADSGDDTAQDVSSVREADAERTHDAQP